MTERGRIVANGIALEVCRWTGTGRPILLLHEGLGSISMWRDFPAALVAATGREVIAWSRQGHGGSDPLPQKRDPDYMHREADSVPALLDALGVESAHFLGHSDGGSISLIVAARYPDRVASLTLEAPHVFVEQVTVDSIAAVKSVYLSTDLGAKLARHHSDADHTFWRWNDIWLDPRFRDWNIEGLLPLVKAPCLLIQGLDDEYGTLDQLRRIEVVLPLTRMLALAKCGHSPHRAQLDAVLIGIASFLDEIEVRV